MKKFIIILGIILTSGIAALAITTNKTTEATAPEVSQVKVDKSILNTANVRVNNNVKDNLTNAD